MISYLVDVPHYFMDFCHSFHLSEHEVGWLMTLELLYDDPDPSLGHSFGSSLGKVCCDDQLSNLEILKLKGDLECIALCLYVLFCVCLSIWGGSSTPSLTLQCELSIAKLR